MNIDPLTKMLDQIDELHALGEAKIPAARPGAVNRVAAIMERDGKTHPTEQPEAIPQRDELVPITLKGDTYHVPYWIAKEINDPRLTRAQRQLKKKGLLQSIKQARIAPSRRGIQL